MAARPRRTTASARPSLPLLPLSSSPSRGPRVRRRLIPARAAASALPPSLPARLPPRQCRCAGILLADLPRRARPPSLVAPRSSQPCRWSASTTVYKENRCIEGFQQEGKRQRCRRRKNQILGQWRPVNKKQVPAVGTGGWSERSLLQGDLVRGVADSFLASNDLDHYMCLRAVCPSWRSATDDPKDYAFFDPRFQPHRWIVLEDDVFQTEGKLLLLNTDTGRFLHKKLPLLREYYVVADTPSGFFVLADRTPPHAARVFNPLTGCLTLS